MTRRRLLLLAALLALPAAAGSARHDPHWKANVEPERLVAFVHIAKTAGTSFETDLRRWGLQPGGGEYCAHRIYNESRRETLPFFATFLRLPRAHVLSQYLMCTHKSPWIAEFDRPHCLSQAAGNATAFFHEWVSHFASPSWRPLPGQIQPLPDSVFALGWTKLGEGGRAMWLHNASGAVSLRRPFKGVAEAEASKLNQYNDWQCYNPMEHQTRQLAASCIGSPHHMHMQGSFLPPVPAEELRSALAMVAQLDLVGITELYALSMCIFLHRIGAPRLHEHCHDAAVPFGLVSPISYHVPKHALADVGSPAVWRMVDDITAMDRQLYAAGKERLLAEYADFNRDPPAGRPLGAHLLRETPV